jgi:hypothetical protein
MASAAGEIFDEHGGDAMAIAELLEIEQRSNARLRAERDELRARDEAVKAVVRTLSDLAVGYTARSERVQRMADGLPDDEFNQRQAARLEGEAAAYEDVAKNLKALARAHEDGARG